MSARFRAFEMIGYSNDAQQVTKSNRTRSMSFHTMQRGACPLCSEMHSVRECTQFLNMNPNQKMDTVKGKGLCLNCLGQGHRVAGCPSKKLWYHCKRRHHSLLHDYSKISDGNNETRAHTQQEHQPQQTADTNENIDDNEESLLRAHHATPTIKDGHVLLATAMVTLIASNGNRMIARALLDQGAESSFVTEMVAQRLQLPRTSTKTTIVGLGKCETGRSNGMVNLSIRSRINNNEYLTVIN